MNSDALCGVSLDHLLGVELIWDSKQNTQLLWLLVIITSLSWCVLISCEVSQYDSSNW